MAPRRREWRNEGTLLQGIRGRDSQRRAVICEDVNDAENLLGQMGEGERPNL
jgi:hypothetical protein